MSNPYKRMAGKFKVCYERGLTRARVLERAGWNCQMEVCLYGDRTIDPDLVRVGNGVIPDQGGSVDHIVPLSAPGTPGHVSSNVRAAHRLCNRIDLARVVGFWAMGDPALLVDPVADRLVDELRSFRKVVQRALRRSNAP